MDFWNCRVIITYLMSWSLLIITVERIGKNTCRTAVLEPGSSMLFSSQPCVEQTLLQVDEDGESYWVFESRDVRIFIMPLSRCLLLLSAFETGKPCGFKVCSNHFPFRL